jgi:CRISPR system Cascade subunit CasA
MNVAFDPWIPVVSETGERMLTSLNDVLVNGIQYADFAVRPHERVALMRLLLCVSHAALDGPKDYDEWCKVPESLPGAASNYLLKWQDSFELFHKEKPWLQVAGLNLISSESTNEADDEKGWSKLSKICFTRASGNNTTLFDHEANGTLLTEYSNEEIAVNLLTFQTFFVAGGKASSRLWGDIEIKNPPNPRGGPCSGKSILFTFLRGKNLFETIFLNLNSFEDLELLYGKTTANWLGKPLWELPIKSPNDENAIKNATQTHLGRLVPQTRMLRINEDRKRVLLGAGFLYPKFQDEQNSFYPDLFATIVLNRNNEIELLSAKPDRAVWRELHALCVQTNSKATKNRGPLCMLNIPVEKPCDIVVCAMLTNPKQAAEIVNLLDSVFHIPSRLRVPEGTKTYEEEVKVAEKFVIRLGLAIEEYRNEIDSVWQRRLDSAGSSKGELKAKLHSIAAVHYWTTVEKNLPLLMTHIEAIDTDEAIPTRQMWRKMIYSAACEAYRTACGQETPRQIRAFAKGWQRLTLKTEDPDSEKNLIKEDEE